MATLLFTEIVPDEVPAAVGEYVTLNDWLWPASMVNGSVTPLN